MTQYHIIMNDLLTREHWIAENFSSINEAMGFLHSLLIDEVWEDQDGYKKWLEDNDYKEEEHTRKEFAQFTLQELDVNIKDYITHDPQLHIGFIWKTQQYNISSQK